MDPQQRVFLECAWEALEHAGYAPGSSDQTIGIYGGASISLYLLNNIIHDNQVYAGHMTSSRESNVFGGNVPESLTTRVAYKLNLTGPAVHLSTACSTSLVAVHSACQSLLNGECDMALAGGVSYLGSQTQGYLYEEGLVLSPDGHCRSFDAQGKSGLVVVKARWVIERSNAWMERCKSLVKNFERTLHNANTKVQLCFLRLILKRLARLRN